MTRPLTEQQFRALVERFVAAQGSQTKAARTLGVSDTYLCQFRSRTRAGLYPKIAAALGLELQVRYVKRGKE